MNFARVSNPKAELLNKWLNCSFYQQLSELKPFDYIAKNVIFWPFFVIFVPFLYFLLRHDVFSFSNFHNIVIFLVNVYFTPANLNKFSLSSFRLIELEEKTSSVLNFKKDSLRFWREKFWFWKENILFFPFVITIDHWFLILLTNFSFFVKILSKYFT